MKWKNSDKVVYYYNHNTVHYNIVNNNNYNPFGYSYGNEHAYPKKDLSEISKNETKTIKPESILYFDPSSGFPRFKLALTDNKRCIKLDKADYIVVSGSGHYHQLGTNYVVLEDDNLVYFIRQEDWEMWYGAKCDNFVNACSKYHNFNGNVKLTYQGAITSYDKDSIYLAKYADGEYTKPYITDEQLDKIICSMCPEPTYEEFVSILDMLDSQDASVVQLGTKMIAGYNVDKYKLSMRLILMTRSNWYTYTRNTVGTKQLIETLHINTYNICDDFSVGSRYVQRNNELYTTEDLAIAKKLGYKLTQQWLQNQYQKYLLSSDFVWLPDERKVNLV